MNDELKQAEKNIEDVQKSGEKAVGVARDKLNSILFSKTISIGRIQCLINDHIVEHHHDGRYTASGLLHDIKREVIDRNDSEEKP